MSIEMASEFEDTVSNIANDLYPKLNSSANGPRLPVMSKKESTMMLKSLTDALLDCAPKPPPKDPHLEKLAEVFKDVSPFQLDPMEENLRLVELLEKSAIEAPIEKQKAHIEERNLEAALQSLQTISADYESSLLHRVEAGAKSLELTIPQLHSNLTSSHKEFIESHNSFNLLDAAITANYCVLRDGYLKLLRRYFEESTEQMIVSSRLEEQTSAWHQSQIESVLAAKAADPELRRKRQQQHRMIGSLFLKSCDKAFNHLIRNNNFHEREDAFQRLLVIREATYKWKARIVAHSEESLNAALNMVDSLYLSHLEELTQQLARLRSVLGSVTLYDRMLDQKLNSMLLLHERESRKNRHIKGHLSVAQTELFRKKNDSEEMIRFTQLQSGAFRLGTRLRGLAKAADLTDEEVEAMLLSLLPPSHR